MNLTKLSKDLKGINNRFQYINHGGCGKFALSLGRRLEEDNVKFKYVLVSYTDRSIPTVLSSVRKFREYKNNFEDTNENRVRNGFSIIHILIYHKGKFIDSEGVHDSLHEAGYGGGRFRLSAILDKQTLSDWCNSDTWNDRFDVNQMGRIENRINKIKLDEQSCYTRDWGRGRITSSRV